MSEISKAADALSKKQHEEIESDYERTVEAASSNTNVRRIRGSLHRRRSEMKFLLADNSSLTSLADVPFSPTHCSTEHNQQSSHPRTDHLGKL